VTNPDGPIARAVSMAPEGGTAVLAAWVVKWGRLVAGSVLLLVGIGMLVLPGPGIAAIVGALALLERDLPFARNLLARIRARFVPQDDEPAPTA
jgi:hypothetical protein